MCTYIHILSADPCRQQGERVSSPMPRAARMVGSLDWVCSNSPLCRFCTLQLTPLAANVRRLRSPAPISCVGTMTYDAAAGTPVLNFVKHITHAQEN